MLLRLQSVSHNSRNGRATHHSSSSYTKDVNDASYNIERAQHDVLRRELGLAICVHGLG